MTFIFVGSICSSKSKISPQCVSVLFYLQYFYLLFNELFILHYQLREVSLIMCLTNASSHLILDLSQEEVFGF